MFLFVKWINGLKKEAETDVAEEPVAPKLSTGQQLLTEIRDLLQQQRSA